MANALTAVRLLLAVPVAVAFARPDLLAPGVVVSLLCVAMASDYFDGRVARSTGSSSARGQLFDHGTDCFFVTTGLTGAAISGAVTPLLPLLIPIAFGQYVVDSYVWERRKQLRASVLGRWNGILYFVPLAVVAASRLNSAAGAPILLPAVWVIGYVLVASTLVSIVDRATSSGSR